MTAAGLGLRLLGAVRVHVPLGRPFVSAIGTVEAVDAWLLRVRGPGRDGVGEVALGPRASATLVAATDHRVRSLVGRTLVEAMTACETPSAPAAHPSEGTQRGADLSVRAGLEAARIDADPSSALVGGVTVNATIGVETLDASVVAARRAIGAGFRTLKLKAGGERTTADLTDRLRAVRDAVGPGVALRIDVNGAWTPLVALERLHALDHLDDLGLAYVEQPIAPGDPAELARLRHRTGVPIAADESVASLDAARALLDAAAVDVLVVKPARVGGPEAALAIAALADAVGVGVVISTLLESGVGLAAALWTAGRLAPVPGLAHGLATADLLLDDLLLRPIRVAAGVASVPGGPGLGITLDEIAVARYAREVIGAWS